MYSRRRAARLAAVLPAALLPSAAGLLVVSVEEAVAVGGHARATLGVTVRVVDDCTATLAGGGSVALNPGCTAGTARQPAAATTGGSGAPAAVSAGDPTAVIIDETQGGVRYVTVVY
jgi:hypothetical protein